MAYAYKFVVLGLKIGSLCGLWLLKPFRCWISSVLYEISQFCFFSCTLCLWAFSVTSKASMSVCIISIMVSFNLWLDDVAVVIGFSNLLLDQLGDVWNSCSWWIYFCWPTIIRGLGCSNNLSLLFSMSVYAFITFLFCDSFMLILLNPILSKPFLKMIA